MMQTAAWIGSALVFATFYVRDGLSMRLFAVLANVAFMAFALLGVEEGLFDKVLPVLLLHVATFRLNMARLREEIKLCGGHLDLIQVLRKVSSMSCACSASDRTFCPSSICPASITIPAEEFTFADRAGRLTGIEVKASASIDGSDFKGLRHLQETEGAAFHRGIVFYSGREVVAFFAHLFAIPLSYWWE